jgi:hypothetical protein
LYSYSDSILKYMANKYILDFMLYMYEYITNVWEWIFQFQARIWKYFKNYDENRNFLKEAKVSL